MDLSSCNDHRSRIERKADHADNDNHQVVRIRSSESAVRVGLAFGWLLRDGKSNKLEQRVIVARAGR